MEKKRKATAERKAAHNAKCTKIDAVVARLDVQSIQDAPGTNVDLDLQLEWHRHRDTLVPKKTDVKLKVDKIKALVEAVERHNSGNQVAAVPIDDSVIQVDVPSDLDEEEDDFE